MDYVIQTHSFCFETFEGMSFQIYVSFGVRKYGVSYFLSHISNGDQNLVDEENKLNLKKKTNLHFFETIIPI